MLQTTKLNKAYGAVHAVSDVSLAIDGRMIYGIIGPNGAGKSTLFRLLSGFERPDSGSILFDGRHVEALAAHERARMGIVRTFQELELLPALTAGEVLTTAALLHQRLPDARELANKVANQLEIPWHALASELNPGMARRIELGRCMLARPKLVLFDEVMAGLTVPETDFMCENIADLHASGVDVVIVEHVMRAVRTLCRHIYVMSGGRLIAEGDPEEISRNAHVRAAYLGMRKGASLA